MQLKNIATRILGYCKSVHFDDVLVLTFLIFFLLSLKLTLVKFYIIKTASQMTLASGMLLQNSYQLLSNYNDDDNLERLFNVKYKNDLRLLKKTECNEFKPLKSP